jgi:hypothetical protein
MSYLVRLHFSENVGFGNSGAGQRVFNVAIQGTTVLTNFDVYVAAGNALSKAVVRDFTVTSDGSGNITIVETASAQTGIVQGIEIYS